jgi:hypothetical protein
MATIVVNATLTATHLGLSLRVSDQVTQAVERKWSYTQAIGTSEEAITIPGDIATLGYASFTNMDATNYVTIGPDSGGAMVAAMRLKAGESAVLRLSPGASYRAQANTAAVNLDINVFND